MNVTRDNVFVMNSRVRRPSCKETFLSVMMLIVTFGAMMLAGRRGTSSRLFLFLSLCNRNFYTIFYLLVNQKTNYSECQNFKMFMAKPRLT